MWFKNSTHILRNDEITASEAISGYINEESLDSSRVVQVVTTMLAKFTKPRVRYQPIATLVEAVLVDIDRPPIIKYSDFTRNVKLVISCQIETAIDNLDWCKLDVFRRNLLKYAKEITFSHEIVDNTLFHTGLSIVPNYLN